MYLVQKNKLRFFLWEEAIGGAFLQFWGLGHKKNFAEELGAGRKFEVRIGHFCSKTHN